MLPYFTTRGSAQFPSIKQMKLISDCWLGLCLFVLLGGGEYSGTVTPTDQYKFLGFSGSVGSIFFPSTIGDPATSTEHAWALKRRRLLVEGTGIVGKCFRSVGSVTHCCGSFPCLRRCSIGGNEAWHRFAVGWVVCIGPQLPGDRPHLLSDVGSVVDSSGKRWNHG
jgi:hypothetical protein